MEEIEDPTEKLQEEVHHLAQHSNEKWIGRVALSKILASQPNTGSSRHFFYFERNSSSVIKL